MRNVRIFGCVFSPIIVLRRGKIIKMRNDLRGTPIGLLAAPEIRPERHCGVSGNLNDLADQRPLRAAALVVQELIASDITIAKSWNASSFR